MLNRFKNLLLLIVLTSVLSSCASVSGPSVIKTYEGDKTRDEIAILRLKQKMKLQITYVDDFPVTKKAKYILLEPGRHEVGFSYSGTTLFVNVYGNNKKYLEAIAGKTYILKNKIAFLSFDPDTYPDVLDVTEDEELHVNYVPLVMDPDKNLESK